MLGGGDFGGSRDSPQVLRNSGFGSEKSVGQSQVRLKPSPWLTGERVWMRASFHDSDPNCSFSIERGAADFPPPLPLPQ